MCWSHAEEPESKLKAAVGKGQSPCNTAIRAAVQMIDTAVICHDDTENAPRGRHGQWRMVVEWTGICRSLHLDMVPGPLVSTEREKGWLRVFRERESTYRLNGMLSSSVALLVST